MKKAMKLFSAVVLFGSILLTTGCNKNDESSSTGRLVRFGTQAQGALTRTEYGGKDNDASGKEPIWWKSGDKVLIVSNKAIVTNTTDQNYSDYQFADYYEGNKSKATVENVGSNGLAWVDSGNDYDFYAVYPNSVNLGHEEGNLGDIMAQIPSAQAVSAHEYTLADDSDPADFFYPVKNGKYTVYEPDMQYAIMTAKTTGAKADETVTLTFNPAFSAFEFTFDTADEDTSIDLTAFRMESTTTPLAGIFTGAAGDTKFTPVATASKTLTLNNPGDLGTVTYGNPKSFTLFAIPADMTDISVYFSDLGEDNVTRTRVLKLNSSDGTAVKFEGGKKYRIHGLKLPGDQFKFFLTINGIVQEWDTDEVIETLFSDQIQCSAPTFDKSAREMTNEYFNSPITTSHTSKNNNYRFDAPISDGRWQVRTLNNANLDGENHDYFTVTFTPTAPLGGYWRLVPYNAEYWTIQVVEHEGEFEEHLSPLPDAGRIMNQPVELRITPNWTAINDAPRTVEVGLYFDCFFSTTIDFDPILDANTEFQDIHGAGTYSYWLLTVERQ